MRITEIDMFDLYGDGTLVLRTRTDEASDDLRYTWYVKHNGQLIYKSGYQRNPFTAIRIEELGEYTVKAFVRNGSGEKIEDVAVFRATRKTSPQLPAAESYEEYRVAPKAEHVSGGFWQMDAVGNVPENAQFAWYIYRKDEESPVARIMYTPESRYVHHFKEPGLYSAKMFMMVDGRKISTVTDWFRVEM